MSVGARHLLKQLIKSTSVDQARGAAEELERRLDAAAQAPEALGDFVVLALRARRAARRVSAETRAEVRACLDRLIRRGGRLALRDEALEEAGARDRLAGNPDYRAVLDAVRPDPATPDQVAARCGVDPAEARRRLAALWDVGLVHIVGRDDRHPLFARPGGLSDEYAVRPARPFKGRAHERDPVALLAAGFGDIRALDRPMLESSIPLAIFRQRTKL